MTGLGWPWTRRRPPSRLARTLEGYPPFTPRHVAFNIRLRGRDGPVLSREQSQENVRQYRAAVGGRIALLRPVLGAIGVDLDRAYDDPHAYVAALHRTLLVELPPLYRPDLMRGFAHELSDRAGADIVLSFMGDLAMLECDVLMRVHPGCFIGANLDPRDRMMASYGRPCLLGLRDGLFPAGPDTFHIEQEYFDYFANMDHPPRLAHPDVDLRRDPVGAIGGWMLLRLERYEVHPGLDALKAHTWLGRAAR